MKRNKPLLIGITGGIGSGKSTVARVFSILGIPIYFADDRAKWLMEKNTNLIKEIKNAFGAESYLSDGKLNREFLSAEVFGHPEKTKTINKLVHPTVKKDFETWAGSHQVPYVLKEAALLFETGSYVELDKIITVTSPIKVRINRVLMRDPHRSEEQLHSIINQQMPDEEKSSKSDFVIKNVDNKLLIPQTLQLHEKLLKLATEN
jgi:dephospho-CoA kinase